MVRPSITNGIFPKNSSISLGSNSESSADADGLGFGLPGVPEQVQEHPLQFSRIPGDGRQGASPFDPEGVARLMEVLGDALFEEGPHAKGLPFGESRRGNRIQDFLGQDLYLLGGTLQASQGSQDFGPVHPSAQQDRIAFEDRGGGTASALSTKSRMPSGTTAIRRMKSIRAWDLGEDPPSSWLGFLRLTASACAPDRPGATCGFYNDSKLSSFPQSVFIHFSYLSYPLFEPDDHETPKDPFRNMSPMTETGSPLRGQRGDWESRYAAVQSLMREHPLDWRSRLDAHLASWVVNQRIALKKPTTPAERRSLLEALGPDFPAMDRWEICFRHLQDFRKRNPGRWPEAMEHFPEDFNLGKWCNAQRFRFRKKKLKDHQLSALQAIGFPFQAFHWDYAWMDQFQHLVAYRKQFPGSWPQQGEEFPPGNNLGDWVSGQKTDYKNEVLDPKRALLLTQLGMEWGSWKESGWRKSLQEMVAWRRAYPDCWPNNSAEDPHERRMAQWLTNQKQADRRGDLPEDRKRMLTRLGLLWDVKLGKWLETLQEVQAFRRDHRSTWPSPTGADRRERRLGAWMERQASAWKEKRLTDRQMALLRQGDFPFSPRK